MSSSARASSSKDSKGSNRCFEEPRERLFSLFMSVYHVRVMPLESKDSIRAPRTVVMESRTHHVGTGTRTLDPMLSTTNPSSHLSGRYCFIFQIRPVLRY